MYIGFGEWKPDAGHVGRDALWDAYNVYAEPGSYSPLPAFDRASEPLGSAALGSASFILPDGNSVTVAGTEEGLYVLNTGGTWSDISRAGRYAAGGQAWRFALWGDYILATDYNDPIQAWRIGSADPASDMSSTAPRCKDMAIVNEFLVCANVVDGYDGDRPNRIWWSPIGDPFGTWEPSLTTMCDKQDINTGGYCVGVRGGSYGIVLMRQALVRLTFIGSQAAFALETVQPDRGCVGLEAFAGDGNALYYVAQDGFYAFDGARSAAIGVNKVDDWYLHDVNMKSASKAVAAVDPVRKLVYFGYVSASAIDVPDRLLAYSMPAGKWSRGDLPAARFTQMLTRGYTLDELDELSTNVDEGLPAPLDSDIYKGGIPVVGGFGPDLALYFSGRRGVEGTIETGDFPLADNLNRAVTSRVRLLAEGAPDATMQIAGKQSVTDAVAYGRICRVTRIGDFTERKSGRYHRFKFVIGGDWGNARGFEAEFRQEGRQ